MKLKEINIENYRSISKLSFKIEKIESSYTYTLIGVNESGKSSFLMAIDLLNKNKINYPFDYFNENENVSLNLKYELTNEELNDLKDHLINNFNFDRNLTTKIKIKEVNIFICFEPSVNSEQIVYESVLFSDSIFPSYTLDFQFPVKKNKSDTSQNSFNIESFFEEFLPDYFWNISHYVVFWKSSPEYLISNEIELLKFSNEPDKVCIPLRNCFYLAGITNIKSEILKLNSPVAIQNLEELLSEKVTAHINKIWLEHPIKIKFKINNYNLTFLVEDKGVKYNNKTTNQRSDGFRQLISFLLTMSVENITQDLSNTIILLDEPETHLHPSAQINLKDELIKISKSEYNNIVFFATHSNYMIDKENIERCFKVKKEKNKHTTIVQIKNRNSSYAEVNYEVFDISTNDYHNELYGYIEYHDKAALNSLPKDNKWYNDKKGQKEDVSLSTYIRHSIHHPENKKNTKYTERELKDSIEILKSLKTVVDSKIF